MGFGQLTLLCCLLVASVCVCSLKEKTELTGLESDVWAKILESNTSFFPLHKALCVEGHDMEEVASC